MKIFICDPNWEALMTAVYEASNSGVGHRNLKIAFEADDQYSIFDEYVNVETDSEKAQKVMDAVIRRISASFYERIAFASMSYEADTADIIYKVILLGFLKGPDALLMVQYREVMRFLEIEKRVSSEAHHFREFIRFHETKGHYYVAHIEPKSRVVPALALNFADRMPSENWMIVDDIHSEAVVHPKNEQYYFRILNKDELELLCETEKENDEFTDLWKVFFDTIAIKERKNPRCQNTLFPIWKRKHAVEFL